jgi:site-specific recombinase XerD
VAGKSEKAKVINNHLDKAYSRILDIYNQLEASRKTFDIQDIKDRVSGISEEHTILEIFEHHIKTIEAQIGNGYAIGTLKHYKTAKNRLVNFIKEKYHKKDIRLDSIDYKFLSSFDICLKEKYHNNQNTAWAHHKHLKKVLDVAIAMDYLTKNPYLKFKIKKQESKREYLTLQELQQIKNKEIPVDRLRIIRDVFLFACYTGLSYCDIEKLSIQHLQKRIDGEDWIIIDRTKTDTRCKIPLLPIAEEILSLYRNYPVCQSKGRLLPVLTNQRMNSYLKELAAICGIQKNLSMHVARHTFATTVTLTNGVPIETVSKILGHSSIKTTQIYARIVDSKIAEDMKGLKTKLENSRL